MSNANRLRDVYAAFAQGDVPSVLGAMDPNIEWREAEGNPYMPSGEPWIGPDAVLENLFKKLGEDWDGFAVHPEQYHDAGDTVVVEGRYSGAQGTTGEKLDSQFCHIWKIRGDKLTSFQQYTDTGQFQALMGR